MLEQELASIMKFTLDEAGNPSPYYWEVQEDFLVPAVYFPTPEITTGGETFETYYMDYIWNIICFHKTEQQAYSLALDVLTAIKGNRNLIPLIEQTGERAEGNLRIKDPSLTVLDSGAAQLTLSWTSRRPYNREQTEKMMSYEVEGWNNPDIYIQRVIPTACAEALEQYATTLPTPPRYAGTYPETS
ncbi:MAG: hypothetical protein LUG26_07665 [Ruminococcus sp.]|nr:hypothetical protein [Ruminococcus sp.]